MRDAYGRVREEDADADRGLTFTDYDGFEEVLSIDDAAMRHFDFDYDAAKGRLLCSATTPVEGRPSDHACWAYDTAAHGIGKNRARRRAPRGTSTLYTYTTAVAGLEAQAHARRHRRELRVLARLRRTSAGSTP